MRVRTMILGTVVAVALGASAASAQLTASVEEGACAAWAESAVWVSLSGVGLSVGEHQLAFRVLYEDQEIFSEGYRVRIDASGKHSVLPVWLGGVADQGLRSDDGELLDVQVEMMRRNEVIAAWDLETFLHQGQALRGVEVSEALILERSQGTLGDVAAPVFEDRVVAQQKGSIICPGAFPYCDDRYDSCELQCYLDENCYQECLDEFDECVYGVNYVFTQQTETNRRYGGDTCAFYPWHQFLNPKKWDFWDVVYQVREYDRTLCPRTGHTYDTLIRQYTTSDICYRETWRSCGGNASYLGGDCRW